MWDWIINSYEEILDKRMVIELSKDILIALLYIFIGRLILKGVSALAIRIVSSDSDKHPLKRFNNRRIRTVGLLINHIIMYAGNFVLILVVLSQFGVDMAPLIAGAGVVGLAVGFAAQSLVKDVIAGFFIIFEDQFDVGDTVQIGSYKGTVEEIGLRITKIKSWNGELYIIPNGLITQIVNFSVYNSVAVTDLLIPNHKPANQAIEQVKQYLTETEFTHAMLLEKPRYLGVQTINEHGVIIRIVAECKPNNQYEVQRLLTEQLKKQLDLPKELEA